jgi:hypothetical protein
MYDAAAAVAGDADQQQRRGVDRLEPPLGALEERGGRTRPRRRWSTAAANPTPGSLL